MGEKVLTLVSGGIDSPVASVLASQRFDVIPLHYSVYPMSSRENAIQSFQILRILKEKIGFEKAIVYPWVVILSEIKEKLDDRYGCVACRRIMLRIASEICRREECQGIVTGESLGQKASQTLKNIRATSRGTSFPVIRPLIGLNKNEIVKLSRKFNLRTEDHAGCCKAVPESPSTMTNWEELDIKMGKIQLEEVYKPIYITEIKDFEKKDSYYLSKVNSKL